MKKQYINVTIPMQEENHEIAVALISDLPFQGITEQYDELVICFISTDWTDETKAEMLDALSVIDSNIAIKSEEVINDKNWNEEWEKNVEAIHVNEKIGIAPTHRLGELTEEIKIIINPKMSFGTGHHATTRLVSRLMDKVVKPESFWIDAGTGTGVLAILAIKLGSKSCYAFDNNEWSIENAIENIAINEVQDLITIEEKDIDTMELEVADGIAANLFTPLVLKSLPLFYSSLKSKNGDLVCSGILKYDRDLVISEAEKAGFTLVEDIIEDEWIAFHFKVA